MSKHTEEPWIKESDENGLFIKGQSGEDVCQLLITMDREKGFDACSQTLEANANLIVASPKMLEALKNIENDDGKIPPSIWALRNEAIDKAEGRS